MNRIKQVRIERGIGKRELARKAHIALSYLHDVEQGRKSPTIRTLIKLASALDVPVTALLEENAVNEEGEANL